MDVIMAGPWMLSSQNGRDYGRHRWAMDALFSERKGEHAHHRGCAFFSERIRPWTSSWLVHGCSLLRANQTMDVIMVGPWMLSSQSGLDHGCSRVRTEETMDVIMVVP